MSPLNFTFSPSNWNQPQTVSIGSRQDADNADDTHHVYFSWVDSSGTRQNLYATAIREFDDEVRPTLSKTSLELDEGGAASFTVKLTDKPTYSRTFNLTSNNSDVTVSPTSLTFSATTYNTVQTVTVRAAQDADKTDDTATIRLIGFGITAGSVSVTVTDDEKPRLILRRESFRLPERHSSSFGVKLSKQPTGNVTVAAQSSNANVVQVQDTDWNKAGYQNARTFTTSNWNVYQHFPITAPADVDTANNSAAVSLTASGGGYDAATANMPVTVLDGDLVELSAGILVIEEGSSGTFTVGLTAQPSENVSLHFYFTTANSDITFSAQAGTLVSGSTLTFKPSNWSQVQTVTVRVAHDADSADDFAGMYFELPGGATKGLVVYALDDEMGLILSANSLTMDEGGTKTFTVKLTAQPDLGYNRKVKLTSDNSDVTFDTDSTKSGNQNTLTFTSVNWNTAQTVTVSAAQDDDKNDDIATINLTGDAITSGSVSVTVLDDDIGLTLSDLETLTEGGSKTFTVKLAVQPGNARTVTPAVTGDSDVTVSPTSLDFTASNWNAAQTVTVSAADDTDKADDTATINLTGDGITSGSVSVTVFDDEDPAVGLTLSDLETLTEGGSKTFTVKLAAQPWNARKVTLAVTGDDDVTVSPASLDFTTANWSTAQTVTVSAIQDPDKTDDTATVSLTGGGITAGSVSVTVNDDDDAAVGLTVSKASLTISEGYFSHFTVKLSARPSNERKVTLAVTGDDDVAIAPPPNELELDFTTSNWDTAQTVTVYAESDVDKADDTATINLTGDRITSGSVSVTVNDDDDSDVGLTLPALVTLTEGGSKTFTVQLAAQPGNARKVTLGVTGDDDVTVSPTELDFTTTDWSTAQTVTVSAADDTDQVDDTATINLTGDGITSGSVDVTVDDDDDDAVGLTLSDLETLTEGGSKTFTVQLAAQPGNARKVTLAVAGDDDVTVTPTELDFTTTDWSSAQTVTVSAADDTDQADDTATVNLTGDGITSGSVEVTVTDDDADVELVLSQLAPFTEGGLGTFAVSLAEQPGNA
ncbi:MAG: hypothetical protein ISN29_00780, partial [Gammaproteobacteria bacterium AqS3]|nr:hypothetical protein [Gammaproteobacteria bacterium AqS3]